MALTAGALSLLGVGGASSCDGEDAAGFDSDADGAERSEESVISAVLGFLFD